MYESLLVGCNFSFLPYSVLRSSIAGSYDHSMLNYLRNHQTVFQSNCAILHPYQQWVRVVSNLLVFSGVSCNELRPQTRVATLIAFPAFSVNRTPHLYTSAPGSGAWLISPIMIILLLTVSGTALQGGFVYGQ